MTTTTMTTITRAQIQDQVLTVWATTTAKYEQPRPVLRVYFCCHVRVMRPGAVPDDAYQLTLPLEQPPRRCVRIVVLSNRGGRAERDIVIV